MSSSSSKPRTSSRTSKLSKAFKQVDEDTRREAREQRLVALEADNYNEQEVTGEREDDLYESEDSNAPKKKKPRQSKSSDVRTKWANRPIRSLERILFDNGVTSDHAHDNAPNYYSIASKPSRLPGKRPFCNVCGYLGDYTCTRCGSRFCSIRCNETHQETRCLKMSL